MSGALAQSAAGSGRPNRQTGHRFHSAAETCGFDASSADCKCCAQNIPCRGSNSSTPPRIHCVPPGRPWDVCPRAHGSNNCSHWRRCAASWPAGWHWPLLLGAQATRMLGTCSEARRSENRHWPARSSRYYRQRPAESRSYCRLPQQCRGHACSPCIQLVELRNCR